MKKIISLLSLFVIALITSTSFAYTAPAKPDNGFYVLDQGSKLSSDQIAALNAKIENLNKTTKNEYGIAIIQSTEGEDIAEVGQTIFRSWGVGKAGLDNGVLLVIALAEHKTRIQTGKGVEGDLPDLRCNDILNDLKPYLKRGNFYEGINYVLDSTSTHVESRSNAVPMPVAQPVASSSDSHMGLIAAILIFLAIIGIGALVTFLAENRDKKLRQKERERERIERARFLSKTIKPIPKPVVHKFNPTVSQPTTSHVVRNTVVAAAVVLTAEQLAAKHRQEEFARKLREEDEDRARKRRREEEDRRSSYSYTPPSPPSFGGSDFGGSGFGGGDSGGGGSSGDW